MTDQGVQFTSDAFAGAVAAAGTKHRFGAVGKYGSIAVIERCWRTLKHQLRVRVQPAVALQDYQRRVELVLLYYAYHRPHRGLGGATPAEVFFGLRPAHLDAASPPRGRSGEVTDEVPFEIVHLDPELRLPLLLPRAA